MPDEQRLEYPVFDELAVWEPSGYSTFRVTIHADEAAKESLTQHCEVNNIGIEDWSTLRTLCPVCSRGKPGPHKCIAHDVANRERRYGFAAISREALMRVLEQWSLERSDVAFDEPRLALLAPTKS